ncbi:MAG: Ppx/GppA family phosphatase, partial [Chromatiales bacterium]|nr:Ppx/GppA family phosphatase [Chromatiales bacterium]
CLERFGQRIRSLPQGTVRAVGTNTLRQVKNSHRFLSLAEQALGHPIEIIAGREEARLVYLGVSHGLATSDERRLVVDIGGGSTELIVGDHFTPRHMESLHMGCVSMTRKHFQDGIIDEKTMRTAELTGAIEIRPIKNEFRGAGWQAAVGSSGTIRAIGKVLSEMGWSANRDVIPAEGLEKLRSKLIEVGKIEELEMPGLSTERRPVFVGGVAVLRAVFKALNIREMRVSASALREGLINEMLGRIHHEDVRESTIRAICKRYSVDMEHAQRIETTARRLFAQVAQEWKLAGGEYAEMLSWGARVHEIGLTISHTQFQKHGAYIIDNSDLPGFSRQEQRVLATLVRNHRRKVAMETIEALPDTIINCVLQLCTVLRLAVLLHRSRSSMLQIDAQLTANGNNLELAFPEGWLDEHPLPHQELKQEAKKLKTAGFKLKFS